MNSIIKDIKYKNNTYTIRYRYAKTVGIYGLTYHTIDIIQVNSIDIIPFHFEYITSNTKPVNIITKIKTAIDRYISLLPKNDNLSFEDFVKWDGDLNKLNL
jgi:hypothetical protein